MMRSQAGLGTLSIGVTFTDYMFVNPENIVGLVVERYTLAKPNDIDGLVTTVTCDTPIQHVRRLVYGHCVAKMSRGLKFPYTLCTGKDWSRPVTARRSSRSSGRSGPPSSP